MYRWLAAITMAAVATTPLQGGQVEPFAVEVTINESGVHLECKAGCTWHSTDLSCPAGRSSCHFELTESAAPHIPLPPDSHGDNDSSAATVPGWLGIQAEDLTAKLRQELSIQEDLRGVIVTNVAPTSPMYDQLVRPGTLITEVNGEPIANTLQLARRARHAVRHSYLRFYCRRAAQGPQSSPFFAVVEVP